MQIVIKIPFRKTLIILIFVALVVVAGYNIAMMVMGGSAGTANSTLLIIRNIVDIVLWSVLAVWFLTIFIYELNLMSHKVLNIITSLCILTVMFKALLSVLLVICCVSQSIWTVIFSVIELMIWIGLLVCMVRVWLQSRHNA